MWERITWSRKQHSLNSLKWNTRTEILQYMAVWSADLINCGETCSRTEDAATGCFPFLYCWLFCGLLCLRPAFLYWGGIHRVASAVCAIWEQSIAHTDGRLLTGISLVGGWLQGWHQQVKSSLVQSNILTVFKQLPQLLTSWRRRWRRVSGQEFWPANSHPSWSLKDHKSDLCFLHVTRGPLSSVYTGFLTLGAAAGYSASWILHRPLPNSVN